jgi:hypothetical protein
VEWPYGLPLVLLLLLLLSFGFDLDIYQVVVVSVMEWCPMTVVSSQISPFSIYPPPLLLPHLLYLFFIWLVGQACSCIDVVGETKRWAVLIVFTSHSNLCCGTITNPLAVHPRAPTAPTLWVHDTVTLVPGHTGSWSHCCSCDTVVILLLCAVFPIDLRIELIHN